MKRFLAVSIGGLGDTILFSPLLKALRKTYPQAHIELLVSNRLAQEVYSYAKEISHVTFANFKRSTLTLKSAALIPLIIQTRLHRKFDIGYFATGLNPKLAYLMKTAGIIQKIVRAPSVPFRSSDFDCNLELAHRINNSINTSDVFIPTTIEAEMEAENALKKHKFSLKNQNLIAIYPSIELAHRPRWGILKLIEVIHLIKNTEFEGKIVVVGSKIEAEEWINADKNKSADAILAGKLSILATAALLKKCTFAIGNDGGLMHVAGAVGCPIIVIMPNTPLSYKPPGRSTIVIKPKISCCDGVFPNRPVKCKTALCAEEISIKDVFFYCKTFLGSFN